LALATTTRDRGCWPALAGAKAFEKELENYPKNPLPAAMVDDFYDDLREALADLEVKASDVEKINNVIRSGIDQFRNKPPQGLGEYLAGKLKELAAVRKRPDWGAVDNVPLWKVAAIVVAVGVFIWAFFRCALNRCSLVEGLSYFIIISVAGLIAKFC
jgi:hypothetical protein